MWRQISILIVYTLGALAETANCPNQWICNSNANCVRIEPDNSINELTYSSQNACRLTCGRFGALWPHPTGYCSLGKNLLTFNPNNIKFDFTQPQHTAAKYLRDVSNIFAGKVRRECGDDCNATNTNTIFVHMNVQSNMSDITWGTDESYQLAIETTDDRVDVTIVSHTVYGARHALETLSQLVSNNECEPGLFLLDSVQIEDRPIYRHRGLLLDTARNYLPIAVIKRTIAAAASCKLNILHWHITDSHSFPLEIPTIPQFTAYGAYGPDQIYTPKDVRRIIQYGKLRGVRVIIEIDSPAHMGNGWNWGPQHGLGDLAVCVNAQPWRQMCIQPPCGQLNPVNNNVFGVLRSIYQHLQTLLPPDETIHMGGDEVHLGCWNSTPEIVDYMTDHGLGREPEDFFKIWAEFHQAALRVWDEERGQELSSRRGKNSPKKVILWSSHVTNPQYIEQFFQKERYIIQTWVETADNTPRQLLDKGFELIMSTKNAWYLDHGFWGVTRYYDWKTVYNNRILSHANVLGGEACAWSELIDENNLDSRIWPRAAAVAERLWSNPSTPAYVASDRIYRHNERLKLLGIQPEPLTPKYCVLNEGQCL